MGLIVGDVVGHNLQATATMGQLRSAVRAVAPSCLEAALLLEQADQFADRTEGARYATLAYVVFDQRTGELTYACAGHPPPLVVGADATVRYLSDGRGPPLTRVWTSQRESARDRLQPGDTPRPGCTISPSPRPATTWPMRCSRTARSRTTYASC